MKKSTLTVFCVLTGCVLLLSGVWIYFQKTLDKVELVEGEGASSYNYHYLMISGGTDSFLWDELYRSAAQAAKEENAYLELVSPGESPEYGLADYLRIGIASEVDGIIMEPDGSEEVLELMQQASEEKIPVITVMKDSTDSGRISYVGMNSYQLANSYADQITGLLNAEGSTDITFLSTDDYGSSVTSIAYYQLKKKLDENKTDAQEVQIQEYAVDNSTDFNAEEFIRDLFVSGEKLPDILICTDETVTECVCQAVVDYNEVGNIKVIGFYYSDTILEAIQKQIVSCTIALDLDTAGQNCIHALEEYHSMGHTSDYYSVGQYVITEQNAGEYLKGQEEGSAEENTPEAGAEEVA